MLRTEFQNAAELRKLAVSFPDLVYCTDNAAMIASAAYYKLVKGELAGFDLNADPSLACG
jgi:N6-L-threonylcarbamoyladenine synthase